MHVKTKVSITQCPVDPKYTMATVTRIFSVNWWDRLFGKKSAEIVRDYRSLKGRKWYGIPDFERPHLHWESFLRKKYASHLERETYIKAVENTTNKTP